MNRFIERFVAFLIAARWLLFTVAILIVAAAYLPATKVRFDRSVENMFAVDDPLLPPYQRLKERFGGNEVIAAVYRDENLLAEDGQGIERLSQVSQRMKKVPGVRDVLSLAEVSALLEQLERGKKLGGLLNLFSNKDTWEGPAILNPASPLAKRFRELFAGYTHSADGKTAAVVCLLEPQSEAAGAG